MEIRKETVILVHGTWAAPQGDCKQWYEVPAHDGAEPSFVTKLDAALEQRGSPAKCWAHCKNLSPIFSWSGKNNWIDRAQAASNLADYLATLYADGWQCHIVAHSLAGNAVIEAVRSELGDPSRNTNLGKIVCLGTPFIDTMSRMLASHREDARQAAVVRWILFCAYFGFMGAYLLFVGRLDADIAIASLLFFYLLMAVAFVAVVVFVICEQIGIKTPVPIQLDKLPIAIVGAGIGESKAIKRILILNSLRDEAWQALHHISKLKNPLELEHGILNYLWTWRQYYLQSRFYRDRLNGVPALENMNVISWVVACFSTVWWLWGISWVLLGRFIPNDLIAFYNRFSDYLGFYMFALLSALIFLWPFQGNSVIAAAGAPLIYTMRHVLAFANMPRRLMTYFVRQRGWPVVQRLALGLEGYHRELPQVRQTPAFVSESLFTYENMPHDAERRALQRRASSVGRQLDLATETLSNAALTSTDVTSLLQAIESDLSLVHAAYYTDDECIERIADWITGN